MYSRLYKTKDYQGLKSWWGDRWGDAPDVSILPQSGMVVESDDGVDLAAGWLYLDMTTPMAMLSWIVTNPENKDQQSLRALRFLIEGLKGLAKSQDRACIMASYPTGSLSRLFESCGFTSRDKDMEHLTINLD